MDDIYHAFPQIQNIPYVNVLTLPYPDTKPEPQKSQMDSVPHCYTDMLLSLYPGINTANTPLTSAPWNELRKYKSSVP